MNPRLEAALERARKGAYLLPVWWTDLEGNCACPNGASCDQKPGKHPIGSLVPNGLLNASRDPGTIRRWWQRYPEANIGERTDEIVRIDIDLVEVANALSDDIPLRAETAVVRTAGRGGLHVALRPMRTISGQALYLSDGRKLGDLKAEGGYVLIPPSRIGERHYESLSAPTAEPMSVDDPVAWLATILPAFGYELRDGGPEGSPEYESLGGAVYEGQGRHNALTSYAGKVWVDGLDAGTLVELLQAINGRQCVPPLPEREVLKIAEHFISRRTRRGVGTADSKTGNPSICVSRRPLHDIVHDAWQAVERWNGEEPRLFRHGLGIAEVRDDGGLPRIHHLNIAGMRGRLDRCADWYRQTEQGFLPARPPKDVIEDMLEMEKPLPLIRGIVGTPTFSSDGTLDTTLGFQPRTGLYYHPVGEPIPVVPGDPDATDLKRAKAYLFMEWLADFPFAEESSQAHAVALPLTVMARELIDGPTPMTGIDAPSPGTGKGLLASGTGIIVQGREPSVMAETRGEEERKRITTLIKAGHPVILLDNVKRRVESAALAALLTAPYWSDRLLGATEEVDLPVRAVWIVTGNNLQFDSDISRRVAWIRLDAKVDRPWQRQQFRKDNLLLWMRRHRHELVWACLVLIQRWVRDGMPQWAGRPLGSFEAWSSVVGGILESAGIKGFLENREELYARADSETEEWRSFTRQWLAAYGERSLKASELLDIAKDHLQSVFRSLKDDASDRSYLTKLGVALRARRDRSFDGLIIRQSADGHNGGAYWCLACGTSPASDTPGTAEVPPNNSESSDSDAVPAVPAEPHSGSEQTSPAAEDTRKKNDEAAPEVPQVPQVPPTDSINGLEHAVPRRNVAVPRPSCRECGLGLSVIVADDICGVCKGRTR